MISHVPLPHCQLPGQFGKTVIDVANALQAPIELVTSVALAAASLAVQGTCTVERKPGLDGPLCLFMCTICDSGERKSQVLKMFFKAFEDFLRSKQEEMIKQVKTYEIERELWEEKKLQLRAELKRATRQGLPVDKIESRLRATLEAEPAPPRAKKLLYVDTTAEALLAGLHEYGNSAALVHDEFGQFIDGHMSSQLPLLNSIWSGVDISVDRKTGDSFAIPDPRLTCLLQAQPTVFQRFLNKQGEQARGNGFLARFLLSFPNSTQGTRFENGYETHREWLDWFYERCKTLLTRSERRTLRFAPDAQRLWYDIANTYEGNMQPGLCNSNIRDFASKAAENIARVAAVLHAFMTDDSDLISIEILKSAIDLIEWHRQQFLLIVTQENPVVEYQRDLDELHIWIKNALATRGVIYIPCAVIMQYGPHRLRKKEKLDQLLYSLANSNHIGFSYLGKKRFVFLPQPTHLPVTYQYMN